MAASDMNSNRRLTALKRLLSRGSLSTQEELRQQLEEQDFQVTQSTISRDLRRLGAVRAIGVDGQVAYRLADEILVSSPVGGQLSDLILDISHNGATIVISTPPGSASLVARRLDMSKGSEILGTLAGDDTVFVAPASTKNIQQTIKTIREMFSA